MFLTLALQHSLQLAFSTQVDLYLWRGLHVTISFLAHWRGEAFGAWRFKKKCKIFFLCLGGLTVRPSLATMSKLGSEGFLLQHACCMVCRSPIWNFIFAKCQLVSLWSFLRFLFVLLIAVLLGMILRLSYHFPYWSMIVSIVSFTNINFNISGFHLVSVYCFLLPSLAFLPHPPFPVPRHLMLCIKLI
jgi:hypothetical protein